MRAGSLVISTFAALASLAQTPPPRRLSHTEVHPDRRVTFRTWAPKASEVQLMSPLADVEQVVKAPESMKKDENGVWSLTIGSLAPDLYGYAFSVDGIVVGDRLVNWPWRPTVPSLLEVPGDGPMFYDLRRVAHGAVEERWYTSKSLDQVRRIFVYTPPDYTNSSGRYPVLYLLHGNGQDQRAWIEYGRANLILDNLIASGRLRPMVVVMPNGFGFQLNLGEFNATVVSAVGGTLSPDDFRSMVEASRASFSRDLLEDLIPFVQVNYRVYVDRDHRAIAGLSMGSGQALSIGLAHLDLFSNVAGFSFVYPDFKEAFADLIANPDETNDQLKLLWIGSGIDDRLGFDGVKSLSEFLEASKIKHTFRASEGGHTWHVWRRYLYEVAPLLFPWS